MVFLLSGPQSEGHGRGGGGCTFNGYFNARVPCCSCWNRKPLTCLHPLTSLGGLKMQGDFTSGSVLSQHIPDVPAALCSDENMLVLCGIKLGFVGDFCRIACSRLLIRVTWRWCWGRNPLVQNVPAVGSSSAQTLTPDPETCNHHPNLLTGQILWLCIWNADWHKLWVVVGRYGLRPRKTHYSTELESSGWLSHDDI